MVPVAVYSALISIPGTKGMPIVWRIGAPVRYRPRIMVGYGHGAQTTSAAWAMSSRG